jgi:TolB-like protein
MSRLRLVALALAFTLAPQALPAQQTSFAVVPFESQQSFGLDQESLNALGGGIAQLLATDLSLSPGGKATPRTATASAITGQDLPKSARIDAATAAKIGQLVGARYVIMGNFVDYYGKFRLNVRVIDAQSGVIVKGFTNDDPKMQDRDQIYLITEMIAQRILAELKLPPAPVRSVAVPGAAVIAFSLGLQAEDAGNKARAASLYDRALQSAPDFPEAKAALARVKGS